MNGFIGVDLDGTLAHYDRWRGPTHIGAPVPRMLERVRAWLAAGQRVKIFTARADDPVQVAAVRAWLIQQGLPELEVTNVKSRFMTEFWDDRCVQVKKNTGEPVSG